MKKPLKIILIVMVVIFGLFKLTEWYLQSEFEALINKNPDRAYDITYENFDLHAFFRGITLKRMRITPINKTQSTIVTGEIDHAELGGFNWPKFLISKAADVEEIQFIAPIFKVKITTDSTNQENIGRTSLQDLLSDVLSRADLNQFEIKDGSVVVLENDSVKKGEVRHINILASEIETDSLQLGYIIPFKLDNLEVSMDSLFYYLNPYTKAKLGSINYSIAEKCVKLSNFSLQYEKDWVTVSEERGIQDDVIAYDLKSVLITDINLSSTFWTNLDIEANKMEIDSLSLSIMRNKNLTRPPDIEKPLFKGIVDKIPYRVNIDSINITNSRVFYGEQSIQKQNTGVIQINDINGSITKLSTFPKQKEKYGAFKANFKARLNDAANTNINLQVPYDEDTFKLHTTLNALDMTALSESLVPLLGVEIKEGFLKRLDFRMSASYYESYSSLVMDYENLHLSVYKEYNDGSLHKKGLTSSMANVAIRHHNLPEKPGYKSATYTTLRNIYRSPFQHIVASVLDGAKQVVPGGVVQSLVNKDEKKKKDKKNKKKKKKRKRKKKE